MTTLYYDNIIDCGSTDITLATRSHCAHDSGDNSENPCSAGKIFNNLFTKHMFETVATGTTMGNTMKEFEWDCDSDIIYEQTLIIGKSAGSLMAYALDIGV